MFYYRLNGKTLISSFSYELEAISQAEAEKDQGTVYWLQKKNPEKFRSSFCISDFSLLNLSEENISLLEKPENLGAELSPWLSSKIEARKLMAVNVNAPGWQQILKRAFPLKWRIHVLGLGDVGGTFITGLRLLGGDCISAIGIYDLDENRVKRWEYEANQILSPELHPAFPPVIGIEKNQLFDCDMFVFCASVGVPTVGETAKDVRMVQLEGNCNLLEPYAKMAREKNFQGIFAVVSDPVDLLCKYVFLSSNKAQDTNHLDYLGLAPEQIRGYGLGVMHARAAYYAGQSPKTSHYVEEGRAYGPHGQDLIIADSILNYNEDLSLQLTEKARSANLAVRATGFKPYVAPALSSGALSILATIRGEWHYSATFMGGVYMGARNRLLDSGTEVERLSLPRPLLHRLQGVYERLAEIL